MPGLLRGVARTAVIAGTATSVSNRVSRRQGQKWAEQEAAQNPYPPQQGYAEPAYAEPAYAAPPPPPAYAAPPPPAADPVEQLTQLAELHKNGILTDAEFSAQKARILGG